MLMTKNLEALHTWAAFLYNNWPRANAIGSPEKVKGVAREEGEEMSKHTQNVTSCIRAYDSQFPFRLVGPDGYPFGGHHNREDAEDGKKFVENFTKYWKKPITVRIVKEDA